MRAKTVSSFRPGCNSLPHPAAIGSSLHRIPCANRRRGGCNSAREGRCLSIASISNRMPREGALRRIATFQRQGNRNRSAKRSPPPLRFAIAQAAASRCPKDPAGRRRKTSLPRSKCKCFFDKHLETRSRASRTPAGDAVSARTTEERSAGIVSVFTLTMRRPRARADAGDSLRGALARIHRFARFLRSRLQRRAVRRRNDRRRRPRLGGAPCLTMHRQWMRPINGRSEKFFASAKAACQKTAREKPFINQQDASTEQMNQPKESTRKMKWRRTKCGATSISTCSAAASFRDPLSQSVQFPL